MNNFLANFISEQEDDLATKREKIGAFAGIIGILVNLLLFSIKLFIGLASGAVSIISDALNNLSDAGTSVVTLVGFRLAGKPPDKEHPFGHGRIEYLTGLFISVVIMVVGAELFRASVEKIFNPTTLQIDYLVVSVLIISIVGKILLGLFFQHLSRKISSPAIQAAATDSFSDCLSTVVVLISLMLYHYFALNVDGFAGLIVSLIIIYSGFKASEETINPLLGNPPDLKLIEEIKKTVLEEEHIFGVHDIVLHEYGPVKSFLSLHAEVSAEMDILEAHEVIDALEVKLVDKFNMDVVVHMDPIIRNDEEIIKSYAFIAKIINDLELGISLHDFRITSSKNHGKTFLFDLLVPYKCRLSDAELRKTIAEKVKAENRDYHVVIRIDRPYY